MENNSKSQYIEFTERNGIKQQRLHVIIAGISAIIGISLLLYRLLIGDGSHSKTTNNLLLISIISSFATMGGAILMAYLQTGFKKKLYVPFDENESFHSESADFFQSGNEISDILETRLYKIENNLNSLEKQIKTLINEPAKITEDQKRELFETLQQRVASSESSTIINSIEKNLLDKLSNEARSRMLSERTSSINNRLKAEIDALSRRGNLNLILGIITTIIGLCVLSYYVFMVNSVSSDPISFAVHFAPRLTLVVFIEIFAYFFLKLYKTSLSEIKYFQNELTNIESKQLALITAISSGFEEGIKESIQKLISTERNFILKKGEMTVDLAKTKQDGDILSGILKEAFSIIKSK